MDINGLWISYRHIALSFGRISDMYGRVKMFRLGFIIFTISICIIVLTPSTGDAGALEIIIFRLIQAVGSIIHGK